MTKISGSDFIINSLPFRQLSETQQSNNARLIVLSKKFHEKAKISSIFDSSIGKDTVILESGHQPNFIPYPGTWKKAFLLHNLSAKLKKTGKNSIAFFGFADQNLATAPLLFRNQIPAINKTGYEKIGIRKIDDHRMKWRCFNHIEKPSRDVWEEEMEKIEQHYTQNIELFFGQKSFPLNKSKQYVDLLWKSYESATSFSEINEFFFSMVSREILDINIFFFQYSALQSENLFVEEWKKILANPGTFSRIYNQVNNDEKIGFHPISEESVPFWYHCDCGGKVPLKTRDPFAIIGVCPVCQKEHLLCHDGDFGNLNQHFKKMGLNAVTRNMVLSEGLGVSVFISGSGGSLKYGRISDRISEQMGFSIPLTIALSSNDYYLGVIQKKGILELMKTFKITFDEIKDTRLAEKIFSVTDELYKTAESVKKTGIDKKTQKTCINSYNNTANLAVSVKTSFDLIPSMLDLLVSLESDTIISSWNSAIENTVPEKQSDFFRLRLDIVYEDPSSGLYSNDIGGICKSVKSLRVAV